MGLGCWELGGGEYWGDIDQSQTDNLVRQALDLGISYFDTAEVYNAGRSEASLGEALRGIPRDKVIIGTKVNPARCYPDLLRRSCQESLTRLQTDYIDLYMLHWPLTPTALRHFTDDAAILNHPPDLQETLSTLAQMRREGTIRFIGVSNFGPAPLQATLETGTEIAVNELPYSLLTRAVELEILPACRSAGIGVIGYMPLLQGLLADIYPSLDDVPLWQRRTRHFKASRTPQCRHGGTGAEPETNQAMAGIRRIARECGLSMPVLALKWVMAQTGITCTLTGTRHQHKLKENVQAVHGELPAEILARLNQVTAPLLQALGTSFDYYEHPDQDRTR